MVGRANAVVTNDVKISLGTVVRAYAYDRDIVVIDSDVF